jgi:hypothetical protein
LEPQRNSNASAVDTENVDPAVNEARVYVEESTKERDRIISLIEELHGKGNAPEYPELYKKYLDRFNEWQQELNVALTRIKKELVAEVMEENPESLHELKAEIRKLEELFNWKVEEWPVLHRRLLSPLEREQAEQPDVRRPSGERDKSELAFHTALHFNRTFTGFNPIPEPKEGEQSVIWWRVWNPGWKPAPEHTNKFTLYKADRCSGCRYKEDEIITAEITGEAIDSIVQKGKYFYENHSNVIFPLEAGHYDAYVDLDIHNQVDEINEDNNTLFMSFTVRPSSRSEFTE